MRGALRIPAVVVAALAAVAAVGTRGADAAPRSFFAVQDWLPPSSEEFTRLGKAGIGSFRAHLDWAQVEPEPGRRDWSAFDALVARAARARIRVVPMLLGSPPWAAPAPQRPPDPGEPLAAFVRFATDAAARYRAGGTFWAERPELPRVSPTHWQVWNEPNFPAYWYDRRPSAAGYVGFLRRTRAAILAGDPSAAIVLAGLPETRLGVPARKFLRRIYRVRGARAAFDVVAIHPYSSDHRGVLGAIVRQRRTMRRAGDGRTPLWITEIGWATGGQRSPFTTTERGQARRLGRTVRTVLRVRRRHRVGMLTWFSLRDRRPYPGEPDWWALRTGLFRVDGSPKPAWHVLRHYASASS